MGSRNGQRLSAVLKGVQPMVTGEETGEIHTLFLNHLRFLFDFLVTQVDGYFIGYYLCLRQDPDCVFIKRWIPELQDVPNKNILNWNEPDFRRKFEHLYPEPLVDHYKESAITVEMLKKVADNPGKN